jgi:flagellin-like hook-associated protein FlgL
MMASVVAMEFFDSNLNGEALLEVSDFVISHAGSASGDLTKVQGRTGLVENRMERLNDSLTAQKSLLEHLRPKWRRSTPTRLRSN